MLALLLGLCGGACGNDNPVKPVNHSPFILSLTAFPNNIGPTDSTVVICHATDSDADTLYYDWITDARLKIKGAIPPDAHYLYSTRENWRVFYHGDVTPINDTAFVQCIVRDRKGGGDGKVARILLRQ